MAGIDVSCMTPEAIRLRHGESLEVDGVRVSFTKKERLNVIIPEGMNGAALQAWLDRNEAAIGYFQIDKAAAESARTYHRTVGKDADFEPLQPYIES